MSKKVKLRFTGNSPHIVEGFPKVLNPGDIVEVEPERAKFLKNGLFEAVKKEIAPTETSKTVTQNKQNKKEE